MDIDQPLVEWFSNFSLGEVTKVVALFALKRIATIRELGHFWNANEDNQQEIKADVAKVFVDSGLGLRIIQRIIEAANFCAVNDPANSLDEARNRFSPVLLGDEVLSPDESRRVDEERSWMIIGSEINIIDGQPMTINKFDGKVIDLTFDDSPSDFSLNKSLIDWLIATGNNRPEITNKLLELRIGDLATLIETPTEILKGSGIKKVPLKRLLDAVERELHSSTPSPLTKPSSTPAVSDDLIAWLELHHLLENDDVLQPLVISGLCELKTVLEAPQEVILKCGIKKVPLKKLLTALDAEKRPICTPLAPGASPVHTWECSLCHLHNNLTLLVCSTCNNPRKVAHGEDKRKKETTKERRERCKKKKEKEKADAAVGRATAPAPVKAGSVTSPRLLWECNMCKFENDEKEKVCIACFTPRSMKSAPASAGSSTSAKLSPTIPITAALAASTAAAVAPPAAAPAPPSPSGIMGMLPAGIRSLWSGPKS